MLFGVFMALSLSATTSASVPEPRVAQEPAAASFTLPPRIPREGQPDQLLWIATHLMFDANGDLTDDPERLPMPWSKLGAGGLRRAYEGLRARGSRARLPMLGDELYANSPPQTFDEILSRAKAMILGTVVALEGGFLRSHPGFMLQVVISARQGEPIGKETDSTLYVFYPAGLVPFGEVTVFQTWVGVGWPGPPQPGSVVLLIADHTELAHSEWPIFSLDSRGHQFFHAHGGRIQSASMVAAREPMRSMGSVEELWREALAASQR